MYSNANQMRKLQRRHIFDITDLLARLAQLLLCIMKQATIFETRANPAKRKSTASEAPSEAKPAKSFCHLEEKVLFTTKSQCSHF